MSKDILKKTQRIERILSLLEDGPVEIKALEGSNDAFNVELRTIQRDIRLLKNKGLPLTIKKHGTYSFVKGFSIGRFGLTPKKLAALLTLWEVSDSLGMSKIDVFKDGVIELRPVGLDKYTKLSPHLMFNNVFNRLQTAISDNVKVRIKFKNGSKPITISPYKIVSIHGINYVISINTVGDMSRYALDNIEENITSGKKCAPRKFDWELQGALDIWEEDDIARSGVGNPEK